MLLKMLPMFSLDFPKLYLILYKSLHLNILVFSFDSILDVNGAFCKITGYSKDELIGLKLSDIVSQESQEKVKILENKLFRKEKFDSSERIKFVKKDKSSLEILSYFKSFSYKEQNLGLLIGQDITYEEKYKVLFQTLKSLNQLIIQTTSETELFRKACQLFLQNLNLKLVWIGIPDRKNIKPLYVYGEDNEYLSNIKISLDESLPEGRGPTAQAFISGKIIINPDSRINPQFLPWKEKALEKGYLSSCAIPLKKGDQIVAVLNLYSSEPYFFDETLEPLLEEIQNNLSFALDKIEKIRNGLLTITAISNAKNWIIITDDKGYILNINDIVCQETGYPKEKLIGKHVSFLDDPENLIKIKDKLKETILERKERYKDIFVKRTKDNQKIILKQEIIPVKLINDTVNYVVLGTNITEELKLWDKIEKLKTQDLFTGLLNLEGFSRKVEEVLKILKTEGLLILLDIWGTSYINKVYGLETGNKLIKRIASLLKGAFKNNALIGRTAGDEFGIFLYNIKGTGTSEIVNLIKNFEKPFKIDTHEINVQINLGCSLYPLDGDNFKILFEKASISLNESKNKGPGRIVFFTKELENKLNSLLKAEKLIIKALEEELFIFHYQPYFFTSDLKLAGFEALVRIKENEKIYYPGEFIDYLEDHSEILFKFEEKGLEKIIKQIEIWKKPISFNLSAQSLQNTPFIRKLIKLNEDIAKNLIIEITERNLIKILELAINNLNYLKSKNPHIKVAIDDFGTGYASFSYLKNLLVDLVKIDISFIKDITKDEKEKNLVKGIIDLCHNLGFKTIAEGVETEVQYKILKELGCDKVQGFYFSKPLPPEEISRNFEVAN